MLNRLSLSSIDRLNSLSLIGMGVIGIFIILYATNWGIGLYGSDSFSYISTARSIADGHWFYFPVSDLGYSPLTHFPPLYSITLSVFEIAGWDMTN